MATEAAHLFVEHAAHSVLVAPAVLAIYVELAVPRSWCRLLSFHAQPATVASVVCAVSALVVVLHPSAVFGPHTSVFFASWLVVAAHLEDPHADIPVADALIAADVLIDADALIDAVTAPLAVATPA